MDDPEVIQINNIQDVLPIVERVIERALIFSLALFPGETVDAMHKRKIEPVNDRDAVIVWDKVKTRIPEILSKGTPEAQAFIFGLIPRDAFWRLNASYEDMGRPTEPQTLADNLTMVRVYRRSAAYITKHNLLERVFWGRVDL